jgi:hypothetical protein
MDDKLSVAEEEVSFWFNLKTLKVERGLKSAATYRVGPFKSENDARNALIEIRKKSDSWAKEDEASL